jgi:hypothetical protein
MKRLKIKTTPQQNLDIDSYLEFYFKKQNRENKLKNKERDKKRFFKKFED